MTDKSESQVTNYSSPGDIPSYLAIRLLSDTTFSRGEGTAGEVDVEIDHDAYGLPRIGGKVLHGLLRDVWLSLARHFPELADAAARVLGPSGDLTEMNVLRVGDAELPQEVRAWAQYAVRRRDLPVHPGQLLRTLTDIRRQTAQSRRTGAPERATLRSSRVALRGLEFKSPLDWLTSPQGERGQAEIRVLALCALGLRHGGLGRNRGRGCLHLTLDGDLPRTQWVAGLRESSR